MTSELDAVNYVLAAMKEAPVSSLEESPLPEEASLALARIKQITREVQKRGWWFNREIKKTLLKDTSGLIEIPSDVIDVFFDPAVTPEPHPVARGSRLFDPVNNTYVFTDNIRNVSLIRELAWEFLPEVLREYAMKRAAREMATIYLGSQTATQASAFPEARAWEDLLEKEQELAKHGWFDNPELFDLTIRWP